MTMKYDKMIEITQAESQRKMEIAKKAISGMIDSMERITVAELVKRTGLAGISDTVRYAAAPVPVMI